MIWTIIISIIGFILFRFFSDLKKDRNDLNATTLDAKFNVIVKMINDSAFNGIGEITRIDKREFMLYAGQNQIVSFLYSTGGLTITWRFKYFEKEVVHKRRFGQIRNICISDQEEIAETIINEMKQVIEVHKNKVLLTFR